MRVKGIIDEDFINYKDPCMYICTCFCDFKCDKESGMSCCQNSSLAKTEIIKTNTQNIVERYLNNPITSAIVFSGLEPIEQFDELIWFIRVLRFNYLCNDPIIIYTGFNKDEIAQQIELLRQYKNIIVKFGRFVPNQKKHYDDILGVYLASPNQYAEKIS